MSTFPKRTAKPQRPRKKTTGPTNASKTTNHQIPSSVGDIGIFANANLTYCLARCFLGNVGEVFTKTQKSIGVIKAIGPSGGFGLRHVRSCPKDSDEGNLCLEEDKIIALTDIKKVVLRNVNISDIQKEEILAEPSMDENAPALQAFFHPDENASEYDFPNEGNFPPEAMFELNEKKFNVKSSYPNDLTGYTVPLDKSDPNFKAKEELYTKIAQDMEGKEDQGSGWDAEAEEDIEINEELMFSAVQREGVQGRDPKVLLNRSMRAFNNRGNNRRSIPRDGPVEPRATKSAAAACSSQSLQDQVKAPTGGVPTVRTSPTTSLDKAPSALSTKPKLKDSPSPPRPATTPALPATNAESATNRDEIDKKATKKKYTLDPDAPEFKPSGLLTIDAAPLQQPLQTPPFAFTAAQYPQQIQCQAIPITGFSVTNQHSIPNGGANSVAFSIPSSMPCMMPPTITPQIAVLRQPQPGSYPQQLSGLQPSLSVSATLPPQSSMGHSVVVPKGQRQSAPAGNYSRPRPMDQGNQGGQQVPLQVLQSQPFQFAQPGTYPIGFPFLSAVPGNLPNTAYQGIPALTNAIPASQASTQPHQSQGVGVSAQQNSQSSMTSTPQPQYHTYNPQLAHLQGQAVAATYAQYQNAMAAQSNALGFYAQQSALYQPHGFIPFLGGNNQHPQLASQIHQLPPQLQSLQLQPGQQQQPHASVQPLQQAATHQPQPQFLLPGNPYFSPQILMSMGIPQQGMQAPLQMHASNVHAQTQSPMYMPPPTQQQPNGNV